VFERENSVQEQVKQQHVPVNAAYANVTRGNTDAVEAEA
jgi:hypothetical protein